MTTPEPGGTPGTPRGRLLLIDIERAVVGPVPGAHELWVADILAIEAEAARSERAELERERKLTARHHRALFVTRLTCPDCWNSDHESRS